MAMKAMAAVVAMGALAAALSGCSNSKSVTTVQSGALTSGNWILLPRSNGNLLDTDGHLRGLATISDSSVSMQMQMTAAGMQTEMCIPQGNPIVLTGSVSGSSLQLNWASGPQGAQQNVAATASINPDSTVLGTYTASGPCTDVGSIYGTLVPPITGSWSGAPAGTDLLSGKSQDATVTASITQATAPSSGNSGPAEALPLSGTVTVASAACTNSASVQLTIDPTQSYITGEEVAIIAISADQQTQLNWFAALTDPTAANAMIYSAFYGNNPTLQSPSCNLNFSTAASLSKD